VVFVRTRRADQRRRYFFGTPAFVALVLLVAGCGGSQPDDTVRDYFGAIVERDGKGACDALSDRLRRDIERAAGRSCAEVMQLAAGLNPDLSEEDVDELEIEVDENGDRATARLRNPLVQREETLGLVKEGGDWKLSRLVTRPTG
jgi:hypothetical protein